MKVKKRKFFSYTLSPKAFYTAMLGLNLLSLAICDTAIRVDAAIAQSPEWIGIAYIPALEYVFAGLVVLCGGVLLIEYIEKRH